MIEGEVFELLNSFRNQFACGTLEFSPHLCGTARFMARVIADRSGSADADPYGRTPNFVLGALYPDLISFDLGYRRTDLDDGRVHQVLGPAVRKLVSSYTSRPSEREWLMGKKLTHCGVGVWPYASDPSCFTVQILILELKWLHVGAPDRLDFEILDPRLQISNPRFVVFKRDLANARTFEGKIVDKRLSSRVEFGEGPGKYTVLFIHDPPALWKFEGLLTCVQSRQLAPQLETVGMPVFECRGRRA
jgi:hypothetical protein